MMTPRKTAVLRIELPGQRVEEKLPLTREREYSVLLQIDERAHSSLPFRSPRNDEEWRSFIKLLRSSNADRGEDAYRNATAIRSLGRDLYRALAELNPALGEFLLHSGQPRRLVIESTRPEIHTLPWGALIAPNATLAAAGDLSIVQAWTDFRQREVVVTGATLSLALEIRADTKRVTVSSVTGLPEEIDRTGGKDADILHVEAHGNAVTQDIGDVGPRTMAAQFGSPKIALLWSCFSTAANSWGESPALCLHQNKATLVLSFQAELHNDDATSISEAFYRDVFGPAASLDPESALVRIRATKFREEFKFANWASMTVFLRNPLDLTAVPLNGPRVPAARWSADAVPGEDVLAEVVKDLLPGAKTPPIASSRLTSLARAAVATWKGTVIVLDGAVDPLSDEVLDELFLAKQEIRNRHPADRLLWFFDALRSFTSPLVVWINALERHAEFLRVVQPGPTVTVLLLKIQDPPLSIAELVDEQRLDEARALADGLSEPATDEEWAAAYFAYARGEKFEAQAAACIAKVESEAEKELLTGNFMSRFGPLPPYSGPALSGAEKRLREEQCYRRALRTASAAGNSRETARAKQELAYFRHTEPGVAERLYREASEELEKAMPELRDSRWHSALGRALRDRADLLAQQRDRLDEAAALLRRAMAIHAFHGRGLQMAYSLTTAARIAFNAGRYTEAVTRAMDAANMFEACVAWRGWSEPVNVLLDALAELGHATRMNAVADMLIEKAGSRTNLEAKRRGRLVADLTLRKAQALWLAGDIEGCRRAVEATPHDGSEAARLRRFIN